MDTQLSEHVTIEQALRLAIGTDQIYLEFQPLVDLQSGMLTSFEALARWHHPKLGIVPPARFIPIAEKSGLLVPLGEQILRLAIRQLHEWQQASVPLVPVTINVAPLQFERTDFPILFHSLALQRGVDPPVVVVRGHRVGLATKLPQARHDDRHAATRGLQGIYRRFRHRLLESQLPEAVADRCGQDRSVVRT